jgi:hypothetical protein
MQGLAPRIGWVCAGVAAAVLAAGPEAAAQGSGEVVVRRIQQSAAKTPEYRTDANLGLEKKKTWLRLDAGYETEPDWIDDLEFTYYVLLRTRTPREPFVLLKGSIAYVNIPKGKHMSTMYVHPSVLDRFGAYEGFAVEVRQGGRPVANNATSDQYPKWLQQLSAREGHVLPPAQTPFAMLGYDNAEMVKPAP